MTHNDTYPEHEKLSRIQDQSQVTGEFLDYMGSRGVMLCDLGRYGDWSPITESTEAVLARYFEINQSVLEDEKRRMLAALREVRS